MSIAYIPINRFLLQTKFWRKSEMKKNGKRLFIGTLALAFVTFLCLSAAWAQQRTITGTVNDSYQIETDDGTVYDVVETEKGNEVAEQVGMRVKVTGTVEEDEDMKLIDITSYTIIGEQNSEEEED
jgi:hypothetical protein